MSSSGSNRSGTGSEISLIKSPTPSTKKGLTVTTRHPSPASASSNFKSENSYEKPIIGPAPNSDVASMSPNLALVSEPCAAVANLDIDRAINTPSRKRPPLFVKVEQVI